MTKFFSMFAIALALFLGGCAKSDYEREQEAYAEIQKALAQPAPEYRRLLALARQYGHDARRAHKPLLEPELGFYEPGPRLAFDTLVGQLCARLGFEGEFYCESGVYRRVFSWYIKAEAADAEAKARREAAALLQKY